MNTRLFFCVLNAILCVSCEKPQKPGGDANTNESEIEIKRSNRPLRDDSPNKHQRLRAAFDSALKIESTIGRDTALSELARAALEIAPDISSDAFKHLSTASVEKIPLLQHCAKVLMEQGPDVALAWAETLGDPNDISTAKEEIALVLASSDPEDALKLLLSTDHRSGEMNEGAIRVVERWASDSPTAAAEWISTNLPKSSRKVGLRAVSSQWLQKDSTSAIKWMSSIKEQNRRRETCKAMADVLAELPEPIRNALLEPVDPLIRNELEQQIGEVAK